MPRHRPHATPSNKINPQTSALVPSIRIRANQAADSGPLTRSTRKMLPSPHDSSNHNPPRPAKKAISRIPEPQKLRILQLHVGGASVREISRRENRSRDCVTRIVKSDEIGELVRQMRAEYFGLAYDAIGALRHSLQQQKDGRLAYRLLMDIGVIPSASEAQLNAIRATQPTPDELTPFERAASQDESGQINPVQLAMVRCAQEMSGVDAPSLPTPEEIWRNRTIAALIDEMTGGGCLTLSLSNMVEWNHLRQLAEDVLQGKRFMTDREIKKVREKYSSGAGK